MQGLQFYTADIVSLYKNIDIGKCVDDILEFAAEHIEYLDLWSLSLTDVHIILNLVLFKSFFTFNNRLYQQLVGLFMGCIPIPLAAVIRVFSFERRSIYTDTYYLSNPVHLFFGRYIDDLGSFSRTREITLETLNRISDMDPDGLLKWELDFLEYCQHFVPFLSTQIRTDEAGILHHKYYRKSQKKDITINFNSHHPLNTKLLTAKNFYSTSKACSANDIYTEESYKIIDKLLARNDFKNPRQYIQYRSPKIERRNKITRKNDAEYFSLRLPYISENMSNKIRKYIINHNLPIRIIFTPGQKFRDIFCNSRPYDKKHCFNARCTICPRLCDNSDCQMLGCVYKIKCNICQEVYIGEASRTPHERLMEHNRLAANPGKYPNEALYQHYETFHPGKTPDLVFSILDKE